jgi:AmmeMemoRadiSam system protein B/AmmeMemoRadiSam system protein A
MMLAAVLIGIAAAGQAVAGDDAKVRKPAVAGSWYPGDAEALAKTVDQYLDNTGPPTTAGRPLAIISPHAGYRYSGQVAASGYRYLRSQSYKRVIVLAFSHRNASSYSGVDVPEELTAFETPLGAVEIDREACDELLKHPLFESQPDVDRGEHSLELQLPFLQRTLDGFKLVPLYVGRLSESEYAPAAQAILPWVDDDTLLVASTDFTHYGPRFAYVPFEENVERRLRELADDAADEITECDFDGFQKHLADTGDTICGRGPVALLLRILSMRGGARATRVGFDTSGNLTGDWLNSVTYQAFVFTRRRSVLREKVQEEMLKLARKTVARYLTDGTVPEVDADALPALLREPGACFVTLENHGRLRGCIGNLSADRPLYQAIVGNAVSACRDQRFVNNPVTAAELPDLHIEISYLTPLRRVADPDDIVIGRHGLMIIMGRYRGVLLPQVAARRGWSRDEFLAQTCRKAGLPGDIWKHPQAEIYSFEAEVFGEPEHAATTQRR